ncbi:hypothetical protein WA026_019953 [Henosepilachna vigintioctopunctata]|uniref:Uncharacterized protein n=1 Tax=Henosepilachna vigintioctopunctata TaxID=420089 RepID=A0AAW1V2K4_9CUCU
MKKDFSNLRVPGTSTAVPDAFTPIDEATPVKKSLYSLASTSGSPVFKGAPHNLGFLPVRELMARHAAFDLSSAARILPLNICVLALDTAKSYCLYMFLYSFLNSELHDAIITSSISGLFFND